MMRFFSDQGIPPPQEYLSNSVFFFWIIVICLELVNWWIEDRSGETSSLHARCGLPLSMDQPQRDGAGMEQTTRIDGVGFFLRALDLQPGAREMPSQLSPWEPLGWNSRSHPSSTPWLRYTLRRTSCWPVRLPHPFNFSPISVIEVLKKIFLGIAFISFLFQGSHSFLVSSGGQTDVSGPLTVTVTTRIITCLVGDPELNPHLPLLLGGGGPHPIYIYIFILGFV